MATRAAGLRLALSCAFLLLVAAPLAAQETAPLPNADEAREAIAQLRSPYCPGLMLEVCPSPEAEALRDSIRVLAAEGTPAGEIVEWMVGRHGEEWRAVPKRSGRGLWAWIIPPIALLAAAGLVASRLRARQPEPEVVRQEPPSLSSGERERLASAMRQWESDGEVEP